MGIAFARLCTVDFYIASLNGIPAACMALVDEGPDLWPGIAKGVSLFIHKLAVKRAAPKRHLGYAAGLRQKGMHPARIPSLRLDCHAQRAKLRARFPRCLYNRRLAYADKL
jgi:hypothetical protein